MKALIVAAALLLTTAGAQAQTDCLSYGKTATLTGTLVPREVKEGYDTPPQWAMKYGLLVLDNPECVTGGTGGEPDTTVWVMQLLDTCRRTWTHVTRIRVTGQLGGPETVHHHTQVLIMAKRVERLGWRLPTCKEMLK